MGKSGPGLIIGSLELDLGTGIAGSSPRISVRCVTNIEYRNIRAKLPNRVPAVFATVTYSG